MKTEGLSSNLISTITSADSIEITSDIVEFAIDQTLESGVLKDIPFVGWIAKLASIKSSISDNIFLSKLLRFLTKLDSLSSKEKEKFSKQIKGDEKYSRQVGEKLIIAIERIDDPEKADILAHAFDHLITGHIAYEEFSEIAHIIDRAMLTDIISLAEEPNPYKPREWGRFVSVGLASFDVTTDTFNTAPCINYSLSRASERLRLIMLNKYRDHIEEIRKGGPMRSLFDDAGTNATA